jgi:hypothetical protein
MTAYGYNEDSDSGTYAWTREKKELSGQCLTRACVA